MAEATELEAHDLAALLCSRVCHDIISPVGAITNGLEVLDEEGSDEETKNFAFELIRKSASQASAKLQFARLAFGAAGSVGAEIDLADAERVARGFMASEKAEISWEAPRALMAKNRVKLILNLLLLAIGAVRGGSIKVTITGPVDGPDFRLECSGPSARIPASFEKLVPGDIAGIAIDAHAVQPYYAGLLARLSRMRINAALEGPAVVITARPVA